jgi:hypothetical protein
LHVEAQDVRVGSLLHVASDRFDVIVGTPLGRTQPWMGGIWLLRLGAQGWLHAVPNDRDDELNVIASGSS